MAAQPQPVLWLATYRYRESSGRPDDLVLHHELDPIWWAPGSLTPPTLLDRPGTVIVGCGGCGADLRVDRADVARLTSVACLYCRAGADLTHATRHDPQCQEPDMAGS